VTRRPTLEAVLFDAGGTLVRLDYEWMSAAVRALGHVLDADALRRAEVAGRRAYEAVLDRPGADPAGPRELNDASRYFRAMLAAAGAPPPVVARALERWLDRQSGPGLWTRPAEGARDCLDALGRLGLRLACVSNSDGRAEEHLAACDLRRGLEFVVDSHHVGMAKPAPGIFRVALERLGLPGERVLYVGDLRRVDGAGARGAGLHFVLLDPYGDYAGPGEPAVDGIVRLPAWVAANFALGAPGSRGAG